MALGEACERTESGRCVADDEGVGAALVFRVVDVQGILAMRAVSILSFRLQSSALKGLDESRIHAARSVANLPHPIAFNFNCTFWIPALYLLAQSKVYVHSGFCWMGSDSVSVSHRSDVNDSRRGSAHHATPCAQYGCYCRDGRHFPIICDPVFRLQKVEKVKHVFNFAWDTG